MIDSIQALRGIAALMVAFGHIPEEAMPSFLMHFRGAIGVDLFFIISGYIMAYTTANQPASVASGILFIKRRFIRIAPVYWLFTLGITSVLFLTHIQMPPSIEHLIKSLLFIPEGDGLEFIAPVIPAGWTLSFEMFFYFLFALPMFLGLSGIWPAACLLTALIAIGFTTSMDSPILALATAPILAEFLFGLIIYWLQTQLPKNTIKPIAIGCLLIGLPLFFLWRGGIQNTYVVTYGNSWIDLADGLSYPRWALWGLPCSLIFFGILSFEKNIPTLIRPYCRFLGNISYAAYLLHQAIFAFLNQKLGNLQSWHWIIYISILISLSMATYYLYEKPVTKILRKKFLA